MDSWYLSAELVKTLSDEKKNWVSLLKKNRNVESHSFTLRDEDGKVIKFSKPHIKIEDLVPFIPKHSYKKVTISDKSYWCFSLKVRVPSLGKVRIVISYDNAYLTGTYAILVSNRIDWSARRIITAYLQRWPIETHCTGQKIRIADIVDKYDVLVPSAHSRAVSRLRVVPLACLGDLTGCFGYDQIHSEKRSWLDVDAF